MAQSKTKNRYYVLVFTSEGPKYVTSVEYGSKTARWDELEKPLCFEKMWAENLCIGLIANLYLAQVVVSKWDIEHQPYQYEHGKLKWVEKEDKDE